MMQRLAWGTGPVFKVRIMGFPSVDGRLFAVQVSNSVLDSVEVVASGTAYDPLVPLGTISRVEIPFLGSIEVMRLLVPAGTATLEVGTAVTWGYDYKLTTAQSTEANSAEPLAFSFNYIVTDAVNDKYAWFVIAGVYPVFCSANVAAGGQIAVIDDGVCGAASAGLQIEGAVVRSASTGVIPRDCFCKAGSKVIQSNTGTAGWFPGLVVTGTAITGTVTIVSLDPNDRDITLDTAATASGVSTITATYNNGSTKYWNVCILERPHLQGQDAVV